MTYDDFNQYRDQAGILHASQIDPTVSLDAIFIALAIRGAARSTARAVRVQDVPPAWFGETVTRLSGERVTVSHFLLMAGQLPVTRKAQIDVGRWMRAAGKQSTKRGGKQLFEL